MHYHHKWLVKPADSEVLILDSCYQTFCATDLPTGHDVTVADGLQVLWLEFHFDSGYCY
jgi:hypothetical protein